MPLDDNLLDAIADTIAETERAFHKKLDGLAEQYDKLLKSSADHMLQSYQSADRIKEELGNEIAAADARIAKQLVEHFREDRLDLDERLFAATKRFDRLSAATEERLADLKDGEPGPPGKDGSDGRDGAPGEAPELTDDLTVAVLGKLREARLGLDEQMFAATRRFDRLSTELEERLAGIRDGEPGPPGADGAPGPEGAPGITGEARGKYDDGETYLKFDRVSFNGSEWIARQDNPGPLPGEGWMLGAQGKRGRPGAGIQRAVAQDYVLVLETTDGKALTIDLRGMFERYDEERGA